MSANNSQPIAAGNRPPNFSCMDALLIILLLCFNTFSKSFHMSSSLLRLNNRIFQCSSKTIVSPNVLLRRTFHYSIPVNDANEDTVVSRCESKIMKGLNPKKIKVTSTNDDPNGSHVIFMLLLFRLVKELFLDSDLLCQ
jgi:hypothetical protein